MQDNSVSEDGQVTNLCQLIEFPTIRDRKSHRVIKVGVRPEVSIWIKEKLLYENEAFVESEIRKIIEAVYSRSQTLGKAFQNNFSVLDIRHACEAFKLEDRALMAIAIGHQIGIWEIRPRTDYSQCDDRELRMWADENLREILPYVQIVDQDYLK